MKDTVTLDYFVGIEDKLLTVSEVAKRCSVHPDTIRRWTNSGYLKCIRHPVNNYRFYLLNDLVGFANNGEIK